MAIGVQGVVTVLLPGTGSDEDYLNRALAGPLTQQAGAVVRTDAPVPEALVLGYLDAMDQALARARQESGDAARIAVGGVSLGAAVATRWALAHPRNTVAVLAVLPPWTGSPDDAPAAVSARHTAATLRRDGLEATTAMMRSSSPGWLADELSRSWRRQWPALPDAMEEAAAYVAPTADELRGLGVPLAVVAAPDDLIHPMSVARAWASLAPRAALRTVSLAEFGPRPELLGQAGVAALRALRQSSHSSGVR